eukprot:1362955-Rhodomonas_salina.2
MTGTVPAARRHRTMYMLGYWSWLWNVCASERVRRFGAKRCVPGPAASLHFLPPASAISTATLLASSSPRRPHLRALTSTPAQPHAVAACVRGVLSPLHSGRARALSGSLRCVAWRAGDLVCADMGEAASALQRDWPLTVHVVTAQEVAPHTHMHIHTHTHPRTHTSAHTHIHAHIHTRELPTLAPSQPTHARAPVFAHPARVWCIAVARTLRATASWSPRCALNPSSSDVAWLGPQAEDK